MVECLQQGLPHQIFVFKESFLVSVLSPQLAEDYNFEDEREPERAGVFRVRGNWGCFVLNVFWPQCESESVHCQYTPIIQTREMKGEVGDV